MQAIEVSWCLPLVPGIVIFVFVLVSRGLQVAAMLVGLLGHAVGSFVGKACLKKSSAEAAAAVESLAL